MKNSKNSKNSLGWIVVIMLVTAGGVVSAQNQISTLRGDAELDKTEQPNPIPKVVNEDNPTVRNYPEQPPLIPHQIDNYQIDINANKCLECHRRTAVGESGAPMISVTHYMDRQNQVLAVVSPRRYFCTQCHVTQHNISAPVTNEFIDAEKIIEFLGEKHGE